MLDGAFKRLARTWLTSAALAGLAGCESPVTIGSFEELFSLSDSTGLSAEQLDRLKAELSDSRSPLWRVDGVRSSFDAVVSSLNESRYVAGLVGIPEQILNTPYWVSWFSIIGTASGTRLVAATNLLYPVRIFGADGAPIDSLWVPPRSWRQAQSPAAGEPPINGSMRSSPFTIITGLAAISDSVLIVAHGEYRRDVGGQVRSFAVRDIERLYDLVPVTLLLDVYVHGVRVASDVPAPGEIIARSQGGVWFLRQEATEGTWRLLEYVWR